MRWKIEGFRRFELTLLILLVAQCLATLGPLHAGAVRPRNVVLIVADDLGLQLGAYGDRVVRTPNLDALAREGTRYDLAFCCTSSCSPSRAVLLSGLHSHANGMYGLQHGVHNQSSLNSIRGLPNLLHDAGYRTASVGKYHIAPEASYHFDAYPNEGIMASRSTVRMAENAEAWIRGGSQPFFLYFCFTDPHRAGRGFANGPNYPGVTEEKYDPAQIKVPPYLPDWPEVRGDLADYYRSISRLDQGVGRLMQALRTTGHLEDTLVIFLSDNGPPFPGAKTTMYEPGVRLPLIVRSPEQKSRDRVSHAMVSWVDVAPTVLDWTGAKGPAYPLQGRSFLKTLDDDSAGWDEVYASHQFHEITMYYPMRMVRTRRYKYILNLAAPLPYPFAQDLYDGATWQAAVKRKPTQFGNRTMEAVLQHPREELFDLERDPDELHNLADDPAKAETLKDLRKKLRDWQERTKDPWAIKYLHE